MAKLTTLCLNPIEDELAAFKRLHNQRESWSVFTVDTVRGCNPEYPNREYVVRLGCRREVQHHVFAEAVKMAFQQAEENIDGNG